MFDIAIEDLHQEKAGNYQSITGVYDSNYLMQINGTLVTAHRE